MRRAWITVAVSSAIAAAAVIGTTMAGARSLPTTLWPSCAPVCAGQPASGPRLTALYVTLHRSPRPTVIVDTFAAGFHRAPYGELCYQHYGSPLLPGCLPIAHVYGRRLGHGAWWLHFTTHVLTVAEATGGSNHALLRHYWIAVLVGTPALTAAQGGHSGTLPPL